MTVSHDYPHRGSNHPPANMLALEDRFEVLKEIGDGSFGSVALARVRTAGAAVARRGTVVCLLSEVATIFGLDFFLLKLRDCSL